MKKINLALRVVIILLVVLTMSGCSDDPDSIKANQSDPKTAESSTETSVKSGEYDGEITLEFVFGERTGTYKGTIANGLPDGYGEFTTKSESGTKWTYKGEWEKGHFNGEGQTEWSDGSKEVGMYINDEITPLSEIETKKMISQPDNYKNHFVEITGLVFVQPEYFEGGVAIQMYTDIDNYGDNVIAYLYGSDIQVENDELVRVRGLVGDVFEGTNAFGAELTLPVIHAKSFEVISKEALHPVEAKIEINQTQTQLGYSVTVQKVEVTDEETRLYLKVVNEGNSNFSLYSFNSKIIQNGKQYEEETNWDNDYPEVQTDLYPGITTEGIITYPPIENGEFTIILEGSSDDYNENIEDYIFNIEF